MDYEKTYREVLERAKRALYCDRKGYVETDKELILSLFPELKESEDERIRKALINGFKDYKGWDEEWFNGITVREAIAWLEKQGDNKPILNVPSREVILSIWDLGNEWKELTNGIISTEYGTQLDYIQKHWHESEYYLKEKQGEQKPTDKDEHAESKFHEGDWIISNNKQSIYKVKEVKRGIYVLRDNADNHEYHIGIEEAEKSGRLWNILDAKDGDVLCYETKDEFIIFIYKNGHAHYHCCYSNGHLTTVDSFFVIEKYLLCYLHPATKGECDLLFEKMTNAGYEWDKEKKELRKIEQKSTWSEEDEKIINKLMAVLELYDDFIDKQRCHSWLKSIKERI